MKNVERGFEMKVLGYRVVCNTQLGFESEILELLRGGWNFAGQLTAEYNKDLGDYWFVQPMIWLEEEGIGRLKEDKDEDC